MGNKTVLTSGRELNDFVSSSIPVKRVVQCYDLTDEDQRGCSHFLCSDDSGQAAICAAIMQTLAPAISSNSALRAAIALAPITIHLLPATAK